MAETADANEIPVLEESPTQERGTNRPRGRSERAAGNRKARAVNGRLLDLHAAEAYSGISAWTLRDLIVSGDLPAVRPPRLRRVWIDREDLDKAISKWKERAG
jgi:hypothetical protein